MRKNFRSVLVVAASTALAAFTAPSHAQTTYAFQFGTLLSGSYSPSGTFASLSISTADELTFTYHLRLGNLDTLFTPGAYASGLLVNSVYDVDPISATILPGSWGVDQVLLTQNPPSLGGVAWDFGEFLCSGCGSNNAAGNRLTANEEVMWMTVFGTPQPPPFFDSPPLSLKIQGLSVAQGGGAQYIPLSPVPEPGSFAILLAGLGLLGFRARRRNRKEAVPA